MAFDQQQILCAACAQRVRRGYRRNAFADNNMAQDTQKTQDLG
jgi:hypothetical protein